MWLFRDNSFMVVDTFASEQDCQRIALTFGFVKKPTPNRLLTVARLVEDNYGQEMITPNIHLSLHIAEDICQRLWPSESDDGLPRFVGDDGKRSLHSILTTKARDTLFSYFGASTLPLITKILEWKNNPAVALCYDKLFNQEGSLIVLTQILEKVFVEPSLHIDRILISLHFDGPEGENQDDDQTNASEAKTNTLTSAKTSVPTEFRLPELNPNEPFLIKNKFVIDTLILHLQQKSEISKERLGECKKDIILELDDYQRYWGKKILCISI
ncbi:unnamed protein product [Rhizophagus irregularis]|nr:unnamed protein product [Rhizophagus irregularis]